MTTRIDGFYWVSLCSHFPVEHWSEPQVALWDSREALWWVAGSEEGAGIEADVKVLSGQLLCPSARSDERRVYESVRWALRRMVELRQKGHGARFRVTWLDRVEGREYRLEIRREDGSIERAIWPLPLGTANAVEEAGEAENRSSWTNVRQAMGVVGGAPADAVTDCERGVEDGMMQDRASLSPGVMRLLRDIARQEPRVAMSDGSQRFVLRLLPVLLESADELERRKAWEGRQLRARDEANETLRDRLGQANQTIAVLRAQNELRVKFENQTGYRLDCETRQEGGFLVLTLKESP